MYPRETVSRRHPGRCADCGHVLPVRIVTFWLNSLKLTVCARCEKAYRDRILWPVTEQAS